MDDIVGDEAIPDALRAVRRHSCIGSQYAWLPAYCKQNGIAGMELGVHVDDKVRALLRPFVEEFEHPAGFRSMRLAPADAGTVESPLFRCFAFPLFDIDKLGIDRRARRRLGAIMDMTWFCHAPCMAGLAASARPASTPSRKGWRGACCPSSTAISPCR